MEDLNNIFISSQGTGEDVITLSVHTRAEKYRPRTTGVEIGSLDEDEGEEDEEVQEALQKRRTEMLMAIRGIKEGAVAKHDEHRVE